LLFVERLLWRGNNASRCSQVDLEKLAGGQARTAVELPAEYFHAPGDDFYHDGDRVVEDPFNETVWDGREPQFFVPVRWPSDAVLTTHNRAMP
jgi:hypothetical protein